MRLLLDTHVFLWWLGEDETLAIPAREAIANPETLVHDLWFIAYGVDEGTCKSEDFRPKILYRLVL